MSAHGAIVALLSSAIDKDIHGKRPSIRQPTAIVRFHIEFNRAHTQPHYFLRAGISTAYPSPGAQSFRVVILMALQTERSQVDQQ